MANKIYVNPETAIAVHGASGADYAWSMEGLANGSGQVSARIDLGAAPRAYTFEWRCQAMWQTGCDQGSVLELYIATSDGTTEDGDVGSTDVALSDVDQRRNLQRIGSVVVEDNNDTGAMQASGTFECFSRYLSIVGYNAGGSDLNLTDTNFVFSLTPIAYEMQ